MVSDQLLATKVGLQTEEEERNDLLSANERAVNELNESEDEERQASRIQMEASNSSSTVQESSHVTYLPRIFSFGIDIGHLLFQKACSRVSWAHQAILLEGQMRNLSMLVPFSPDSDAIADVSQVSNLVQEAVDMDREAAVGSIMDVVGSSSSITTDILNQLTSKVYCISCSEYTFENIVTCPCSHSYCLFCLKAVFEACLMDRSLIPARCCKIPFPPELCPAILDSDQLAR